MELYDIDFNKKDPVSTTFVNFRDNGNQSAKINCGFYGSPLQSCYNTLYFYDSLHNLIKVLEYTPDSTLAKRTIYNYTGKYLIKKKKNI